jgi:hypothetical protein
MWQEQRGEMYFRFQTDEKSIADKMKRRQKFSRTAYGMNCTFWIYRAHFTRPDLARAAFKSLTGEKIKYNAEEDIYCGEDKMVEDTKISPLNGMKSTKTYAMLYDNLEDERLNYEAIVND